MSMLRRSEGRWRLAAVAVAAQLLAVLAPVASVRDAEAYRTWCRSDPVVAVDGVLADVFVSVPVDGLTGVNGPTRIVITVPDGVGATLAVPGVGFGYGEEVSFVGSRSLAVTDNGIQVRVAVYLPASDGAMPVQVEVAPRVVGILDPVVAEGAANAWLRVKTQL
jgi:hypothetical protein